MATSHASANAPSATTNTVANRVGQEFCFSIGLLLIHFRSAIERRKEHDYLTTGFNKADILLTDKD